MLNTSLCDLYLLGLCSLHALARENHKQLLIKERLGAGYVLCEMMMVGPDNVLLGGALDLPVNSAGYLASHLSCFAHYDHQKCFKAS